MVEGCMDAPVDQTCLFIWFKTNKKHIKYLEYIYKETWLIVQHGLIKDSFH